jgi:hypothetical protein
MTKARLNSAVTYPSRRDSDRPWLPGPPPNRQEVPVEQAEADYDVEGFQDLQIPIRRVNLLPGSNFVTFSTKSLFKQLIPPVTSTKSTRYLFHGCATNIDRRTLLSFSKMGPSIKFSRPRSYFSRQPAVYWTDSIEFALAWCVFTKTGKWKADYPSDNADFECIIYVTEINLNSLSDHFLSYSIPSDRSIDDEQALVDVSLFLSTLFNLLKSKQWCLANIDQKGDSSRIPPPGTTMSDWNLIISRIPKVSRAGRIRAL